MKSANLLLRMSVIGCVLGAALGSPASALAATWNSVGEANWSTSANWDTGTAPNTSADGWVATLESGTAVHTGATFNIPGASAMLTLDGGSFRYDGAAGAVNVWWGGKMQVNAGAFDIGSRPLYVGPGTGGGTVTVTGGSLNAGSANLMANSGSQVNISGGSLSVTGDFNLYNGSSVLMSGGALNTHAFAFQGTSNAIATFSGGQITSTIGVWSSETATGYVNFTAGSTGVIHILNDAVGAEANWQVRNGDIRFEGVTDSALFTITADGTGGTFIRLTAVPEPMSMAILAVPALALMMRRRS